jgi:hypothetical protein
MIVQLAPVPSAPPAFSVSEKLCLAIMTVQREPTYLYQTLASLFACDPLVHRLRRIAIVADGEDFGYLDPLRHHARVHLVPMPPDRWAEVKDFGIHRRACHNFVRCLESCTEDSDGILVCEDDVVFRDGFLGKLLQSLHELTRRDLREFILAAYAAYDHEADRSLRRGRYYSSYPAHTFYGTQCVFFPRSEALHVAEEVRRRSVKQAGKPYDLVIHDYAVRRQHLYATRFSLAQHVGRRTSGLGHFHQSPTFHRPWPAEEKSNGV